ncbi:MAG: RtcB family protein [Candidatus Nanohaloarchaea archaeon]
METNKVDENIYEIEREGEMQVPARIYASEPLLEKMKDDKTLEQVKNVAHLPGIQKYSIVLPDGHQGYGFPIGGVAAVDNENGVISPGGIGYDINCLTADSEVLLRDGRRKRISELKDSFDGEKAVVAAGETVESDIILFTENEGREVFSVETETGETLEATADHPLMTEEGMVELEGLSEGSQIFVRPFKGLADSEPKDFTVLDEDDFRDENWQLAAALKERDLLPLKSTDEEFNTLLKLVAFHTGDGSFNNHGETTFYAEKHDLETIRNDIESLGFKPSKIYSRERDHEVKNREFSRTEHSVKSTSKAFQKLIRKLGAPKGEKTSQEFTTPDYLERLEGWQKALYLSAFFGAEMSAPTAQSRKNLYCPKISQNKAVEVEEAGRKFMKEIKEMLEDLGVRTNSIESFEAEENRNGKVKRFRLGIKNDSENLIDFYQRIGYRYNLEKRKKSVKAVQYLKKKQKAIEKREDIAQESIELYESGKRPKKIKQKFDINNRFIERSIYSGGRKTVSRPPETFPDYNEFAETVEVRDDLAIKTSIKSIEKKGKETVYDIGVRHEAHNFIANQFVVSNCGVRMLKTDLNYEDVKGREEQLANILFNKVPVGLGKGGYIDVNRQELEEILERGMEWMLENGHAREDDLKRCEENGRLPGDADKVPEDAKKRGIKQVGSLGSGNHFLEVQAVSEVFDAEKAQAFGLEEEQVVVMIHSGSRGLGHQTCTEYLRRFEKEYPEIVESLPDKELIYAPIGDEAAEDYRQGMYAAANFAWANRQAITEAVRDCFGKIFDEVEVDMLYDVCHNIAKEEEHEVDGETKELLVHRKGATRAMPAGREEVPEVYSEVGQPVLLPGTMGTSSYVLSGGEKSLELSFGSTAHGAGRLKSRTQSKKDYWGEDVKKELEREEIYVRAASGSTVAEEAPGSYKDVDEVIKVSDQLGIGDRVVKTRPIVNIKG